MHHVVLDAWSRRSSFLHARDARAKLIVLLLFLVWLGTVERLSPAVVACYGAILAAGAAAGKLPVLALLARTALVLPFAATFALLSLLSGDGERAASLLLKSTFSAFAVLLVVATTPMPKLLHAFESLGVPRLFTMVVQFLYRYLFVLAEKAQHMRLAAASRGGFRFQAAGGAAAVLFGASYGRAEGIHRAMLARGFDGRIQPLETPRPRALDIAFAAALASLLIGGRLLWRL